MSQSSFPIYVFPFFCMSIVLSAAVSQRPANGQSSVSDSRPPEVVVLNTIEDNAGFGMELHRVSIRGVARDSAGKPISAATVYVASQNPRSPGGFENLRGQTTSDEAGRYELSDVQLLVNRTRPNPLPEPAEGGFVVFGVADGYGITWSKEHRYRPEERQQAIKQQDAPIDETVPAFYRNEPMVVDLDFDLPATLQGQITDDFGQPIAGATVSLGLIRNWRNLDGGGMWSCRYVGKVEEVRPVPFGAIRSLPAELRETTTGADGRYRFDQLRRDTIYLGLITPGPLFDAYQFSLSTQEKRTSKSRLVHTGYDGTLGREFETPRDVNVVVVDRKNERPVSDAIVTAYHKRKIRHVGSRGRTDANGETKLRLPPSEQEDDYELCVEPSSTEPLLLESFRFTVPKKGHSIDVPVKLQHAAIVQIRCVDADSGNPVSGVRFEYETDTHSTPQTVSSQSVYVDHPVTNNQGMLTAYLPPGRRRFIALDDSAGVERSQSVSLDHDTGLRGELVELVAGETTKVQFEIPSVLDDSSSWPARKSVFPKEYAEKWDLQGRLMRDARAKVSVRLTRTSGKKLDAKKMLETFRNLDPYQVPNVEAIFNDTFDAKLHMTPMVITVDGSKKREDTYSVDIGSKLPRLDSDGNVRPTRTMVSNGFEFVSVSGFNNQVDVNEASKSRHHISSLHDLCRWPLIRRIRPGQTPPEDELPQPNIIDLGDRVAFEMELERGGGKMVFRQVCDKKTGFIFEFAVGPTFDDLADVRFYFAPTEQSNGLILPGMEVSWKLRDNKIQHYELHLIDEVKLLDAIAPETFAVAIPAGSMIVDYRGISNDPQQPRQRPEQVIVKSDVTDTVAYLQRTSPLLKRTESKIKYGQKAPDLEVASWVGAGGEAEAPDLSGKVVLIDFWGIHCGPCVGQLPEVRKAATYFADKPLLLLGLHDSHTTPEELRAFAEKEGLTFQLAIDKPASERGWFGETMRAYGIRGIPSSAVIDQEGNIVFVGSFKESLFKVEELLP
ncbi:Peroxiredoxin [Neorhodopirellula lusitana]|uniref:Peroxiredoxin n=1 Tax=Neorhodopirellula lusitana TaxID=445327 RepID=A0ABY1Q8I9_9BACT|nr:redoxin domain-containing protein [Neorhodopirellula lusitana]SMP63143.1 Peroxiredoxin [Neorhodopirellula lusitana]